MMDGELNEIEYSNAYCSRCGNPIEKDSLGMEHFLCGDCYYEAREQGLFEEDLPPFE